MNLSPASNVEVIAASATSGSTLTPYLVSWLVTATEVSQLPRNFPIDITAFFAYTLNSHFAIIFLVLLFKTLDRSERIFKSPSPTYARNIHIVIINIFYK